MFDVQFAPFFLKGQHEFRTEMLIKIEKIWILIKIFPFTLILYYKWYNEMKLNKDLHLMKYKCSLQKITNKPNNALETRQFFYEHVFSEITTIFFLGYPYAM